MVRTKDILFFFVQSLFVYHFERHTNQNKHEFGPPSVELPYQPEFLSKNDGYKEEEEKDHEKNEKNYKAI